MSDRNKTLLAVFIPILIVGGSLGLYFALKPKKCPDGLTNVPRNPFTGKRDISACPTGEQNPPPPSSEGVNGGNYGGSETVGETTNCRFPIKNQSGSLGDSGSQKCVAKIKQALASEINEIGYFDENIYGDTVERALDTFLEEEVGSNEEPLSKMKQLFGGCGNMLQGYGNCKLFNDQYRQLLQKRSVPVSYSNIENQWV
jgi:hypothetical protein